jgi:hypothetical protein
MLSGLNAAGPSMFSSFQAPQMPSITDMEAARDAALYSKTVKLKEWRSVRFDLTVKAQNTAYEKLMLKLHAGSAAGTHLLVVYDITFAPSGLKNGPGHLVHIQWQEVELQVTANETISPSEGN